jgi:hypothetical protein
MPYDPTDTTGDRPTRQIPGEYSHSFNEWRDETLLPKGGLHGVTCLLLDGLWQDDYESFALVNSEEEPELSALVEKLDAFVRGNDYLTRRLKEMEYMPYEELCTIASADEPCKLISEMESYAATELVTVLRDIYTIIAEG